MDYTCEPKHSQLLAVQGNEPFNAEPSSSALVEFPITPEDLVYCRNHGPVRQFDEGDYSLTIRGGSNGEIKLSMHDLKTSFPITRIVAVLQCAGIRRKEMGAIKKVKGVSWADGVIANCRWGGVRLYDLLKHAGTPEHQENLHICFESHATLCQDDTYYGASIPLVKAMKPEEDILVAYEMNNEPLSADHGGPLRIVVPGFLGARWVKWLDTIIISSEESLNFYQQRDYKILPPHIESSATAPWAKYPSMTALPLNSVIGVASRTSEDTLYVKGYAIPGPCGNVQAVEITIDEGKTWQSAQILYQQGRWSWTLWEAEVNGVEECGRVYCRAIDSEGNFQPREGIWNLRGLAYNSWGVKDWI